MNWEKFLGKKILKLTQEEIGSLNKSLISNEIELIQGLRIPKTIFRMGNALGGLSLALYSWLGLNHSERTLSTISNGNGACGKGLGKQVTASKDHLSLESHRTCLMYPAISCDSTCPMLLIIKAHKRLITLGWSCRQSLPGTYQNSRLPGGVQRKPHCLYKKFRQSETILSGNGGIPPKI